MTPTRSAPSRTQTIVASGLGTFIEWFDWSLFGLFALYFSSQFFPSENKVLSMLATALSFAIAFVFRPIGGWLLGLYADRRGRRGAMVIAMLLMVFGSLAIGLTPSYATIGWLAPAVLVLARVAQGISTGGDSANVYVYMAEIAPATHRYRYGAWVYIFSGAAFFAASIIGYFQSSLLDGDAMAAWGWRVPFVIGGLLGVIGTFLRLRLAESLEPGSEPATDGGETTAPGASPASSASSGRPASSGSPANSGSAAAEPARHPLWSSLTRHPKAVLQLVGFTFMMTLVYYALTVTFPSFAEEVHGAQPQDIFLAVSIGTAVYMALHYPVGALADRVGPRPILLASAALYAVMIVPLSYAVTGSFAGLVLLFTAALAFFAPLSALAPVVYADLFPASIRATGVGTWYNISVALFGGTVSLIMGWLTQVGHTELFFWYIALASAAGFVALWSMRMPGRAQRPADAAATLPVANQAAVDEPAVPVAD